MNMNQWNEFLSSVTNEEVVGFEEKAHEWASRYAAKTGDITAESCLTSFFGDNPREWLKEAYDSICSNCKSDEQSRQLLKNLYEEVMVLVS